MSECKQNSCNKLKIYITCFGVMCLVLVTINLLCSCTISFQNISTHGTATDLVDENQGASPDIRPTIQVPLSPLP